MSDFVQARRHKLISVELDGSETLFLHLVGHPRGHKDVGGGVNSILISGGLIC